MAIINDFNNLVRQYNRRGIEDNALAEVRERIDDLYMLEYGRHTPKVKPVRYGNNSAFNDELSDIMEDFINDKTKKIKMFDMRKKENKQRIETFKKNHPDIEYTPQAYIDYIESFEDFKTQVFDLASLESHQIKEIFSTGTENGLTTEQIINHAEQIAEKMKGVGMNINKLAELIRNTLSAITPDNVDSIDYAELINAINEGKFSK